VSLDEDSYEFDDFYPFTAAQAWVVLSTANPNELAVYQFVCAHLNLTTGKLEGHPSRDRIAERFSKSVDWVDRQVKGLVELGAVEKVYEYWDAAAKRRTRQPARPDGAKNAQTSNTYRVKLKPPQGAAYAGPITIAEYYKPALIEKRVQGTSDQRKEDVDAGQTRAATVRPSPAA